MAALLRVSGLLPRGLDVGPLLAEAKAQLKEEADYEREGRMMTRYTALLAGSPEFVVPNLAPDFTTPHVLAMSFEEGAAVETLVDAPQEARDAAMTALIGLVLRELFEFGLMQTDPNFANYRHQPATGRLVLLDFGAVREVSAATREGYRALLAAGLAGTHDALRDGAVAAGFLGEAAVEKHRASVDRILGAVLAEFTRPGPFDFGDRSFVGPLREEARALAADRATWHVPPAAALFVQRKVSGTALLAARLKARVDVRALLEPGVAGPETIR